MNADRHPIEDPREGDWLTCDDGEIRVDLVRNGWVYFVSWRPGHETGSPRRMRLADWIGAAMGSRLTFKGGT